MADITLQMDDTYQIRNRTTLHDSSWNILYIVGAYGLYVLYIWWNCVTLKPVYDQEIIDIIFDTNVIVVGICVLSWIIMSVLAMVIPTKFCRDYGKSMLASFWGMFFVMVIFAQFIVLRNISTYFCYNETSINYTISQI